MIDLLTGYMEAAQRATDMNDHTGAVVLMARYVVKQYKHLEGVTALLKSAQAVATLHSFYGHMPPYLKRVRDEVAAHCESFMTEQEIAAFRRVR